MIWLIPYIEKCLEGKPGKELVIWGAGKYGLEAIKFAELYFPQLKIRCIVDEYKEGSYLGYPISTAKLVSWDNTMVWIAFVHKQMEVAEFLCDVGLAYHKNFFFLAPMNL